jgi:diphthamide biosynthesis enzyme Dph1/Dph2-like protein
MEERMNHYSFDLEGLFAIIKRNSSFKCITLQFIDDYIPIAVEIYMVLSSFAVSANLEIDFYLITDSTWGTSVDDISANHVTTDLLVYFGSDLSSSSSIPVIIMIEGKPLTSSFVCLYDEIREVESEIREEFCSGSGEIRSQKCDVILCYEPCYYVTMRKLFFYLSSPDSDSSSSEEGHELDSQKKEKKEIRYHLCELPPSANLSNWRLTAVSSASSEQQKAAVALGGLLLPASLPSTSSSSEDLSSTSSSSPSNSVILYIGNKKEQIEKILFRFNNISFYQINPSELPSQSLTEKDQRKEKKEAALQQPSYTEKGKPEERKQRSHLIRKGNSTFSLLNERYGGIERVKKAKIIGLLIGSMGYEIDITSAIIDRLEKLIRAAGKYFYTFVMGRINESKLCNFPEIELYCLIANDDISIIKPK